MALNYKYQIFCLHTLQWLGEHLNSPPLMHGSLKEILTHTFKAFVKESEDIYAVGAIVSAAEGKWLESLFSFIWQGKF